MSFIAESRRNKLWFGTEERMGWFPTPNRSPDLSPSGWADGGTLLNGGGFQLNSFGSHKEYIFEWPQSSQMRHSQLMKSYADGSFGRGLIYFLDPLIYTKNVLPAMWADPSMGIGYEGSSLVYGVDPTALPTSNWEANELPIKSAYYDLGSIATGWRGKEDAVFIPVPEGYTFSFGSIHSQTGQGRVYYRTQSKAGALGTITEVTPLPTNTAALVNTFVSGVDLAGVWLFIGKAAAGAGSVTLSAMTGRLLPTAKAVVAPVATNLFTNPRLVGDGTWAEVRRNRHTAPDFSGDGVTFAPNVTGTISPGEADVVVNANTSANIVVPRPSAVTWMPAAGEPYFASYEIENVGSVDIPLRISMWNTVTYSHGEAVIIAPGETKQITLFIPSYAGGGTYVQAHIGSPTAAPAGAHFKVRKPYVGSAAGPYFDGSTTPETAEGVVQPEDFRWRWLGTPNASESVMEIERVRGMVGSNSIPGVSMRDGKRAMRIIATHPTAFGYATFILPEGPIRDRGTLVATRDSEARLRNYALRVDSPQANTGTPGLELRVDERLSFGPLSGTYRVYMYSQGFAGEGDVWWTDIGLFAGNYDGPVFNGSSGTIMIGSQLATTEWDGATDNSTSTAYSTSTELINIRKGPWIGGQGHSGCRFIGKPTYSPLSPINGGQVGFSASFKEVGSWVNG